MKKLLVQPDTECLCMKEAQTFDIRFQVRYPMQGRDFFDLIEGLLAPFDHIRVAGGAQPGGADLSELLGPIMDADEATQRIWEMADESKQDEAAGLGIDISGWEEAPRGRKCEG